jgi:hypothetical protein
MSKRRKFSPEFKRGAVEQTRQPGVSCAQVARELGIGAVSGHSAPFFLDVVPGRSVRPCLISGEPIRWVDRENGRDVAVMSGSA